MAAVVIPEEFLQCKKNDVNSCKSEEIFIENESHVERARAGEGSDGAGGCCGMPAEPFLIVSSIIILVAAIYSIATAKSHVNYLLAIGIILFILVLAGVFTKNALCMLGVVIIAVILIIIAIVNLIFYFMDDSIKFFSLSGILIFIILVVFLCLSCHICYAGNALRAAY